MKEEQTFAMETTASGLTHQGLMRDAHKAGLATAMLYFSVRDLRICLERIARRVAEGGHDVATDIVERRFHRSHDKLPAYAHLADLWRIYDASGARPLLALEGKTDAVVHRDDAVLDGAHPALKRLPLLLQAAP